MNSLVLVYLVATSATLVLLRNIIPFDWQMARKKRDTSSRPRSDNSAVSSTKRHRQDTQETSKQLYAPDDAVLVLGDGDFSFSRGLVKHRGTGRGVLATSFDSECKVRSKYPNAQECISAVRSAHGLVLHDVDATKLLELPQQAKTGTGLKTIPDFFQYIVFNFPHSGQQRVHINRALLLNFFESARDRLTVHGEAHVTLKTRPPYSNWFIEDQAKAAGFVMKERRKFNIRLFPGYRHRTTDPQAKKFEPDLCVTYVFVVNRSKYPFQKSRAALNAANAEMVATEAREQHDLAAAIVNLAKSKADKNRPHDPVVRAKPTKTPAKSVVPIVDRPDSKMQTKKARPNHDELWKPLHRRVGAAFF